MVNLEQHPGVSLGEAKTATFSALWFRLLDDHVSPRAGMTSMSSEAGTRMTSSSAATAASLVESIEAFGCQTAG